MPSFDCGGGRCGEFSCASCYDGETRKEYWALFSAGTAKSDAEARRIMTARIERRVSLAKRAPQLLADLDAARAEVARLTAEVEAMRAALRSSKFALIQAKKCIARNLDTGGEDEWAQCDYAIRDIDAIDKGEHLDALRARKVGG